MKGLPMFITEVRLAGIESYNNVIKQITYNSLINISFITSIFYALVIMFNKITEPNNDHCKT